MSKKRVCRKCGAAVPSGELDGLCSSCVAKLAFLPDSDSAPARDLPATRLHKFGDYELIEEIARGGMGVVYKARQISLKRTVAVKMILSGQLASPADVQRFRAEAEAAASLRHPNIVAIHEVGEHEGQHYFSMDYVDGRDLTDTPIAGRLATFEWFRRAAGYLKVIAGAIDYAHQQGTLHRDLKPSNILIDDSDQPHITDFGLAKRIKGGSDLTVSGQIIGTPNFMPPEQAAGNRAAIGPCSDIYSLGAVLYFLLTGQPPFHGASVHDTITKVLISDPIPPRTLRPELPKDLEVICLKCLEKEPARRYRTAKELADDLGRFLSGEPVLARPTGRTEKLWRTARRHRLATVLGAALLVLLITVAVLIERRNLPGRARAGPNRPDQTIAPMPFRSAQGISAIIDGKFYVTSATAGLSDDYPKYLFVYDPRTNHWKRRADSHAAHSNPAGGAIGGKLYLAGGIDGTNGITAILEAYNPTINKWSFKKPMPSPRQACASVVFHDMLFVIGGIEGTNLVSKVEAYDPDTDAWVSQPDIRLPRANSRAVVLNDSIVLVGGATNHVGACTGEVETWRPGETNWSIFETYNNLGMPAPVDHPFVATLNDVLYVFGGSTTAGAVDRSQCLTPGDHGRVWLLEWPMPAIRYGGCGALAYGDEIWLLGGWTMHPDPKAFPHSDVFAYRPDGNSWRTSSPPNDTSGIPSSSKK